jgi:hypothetical protein
MAREIVWRCDGCGELRKPEDLSEFLWRLASETTQNYQRSVQLCVSCCGARTAADIVRLTHEQV